MFYKITYTFLLKDTHLHENILHENSHYLYINDDMKMITTSRTIDIFNITGTANTNKSFSDKSITAICNAIISYHRDKESMQYPYVINILDVDVDNPITQREYDDYMADCHKDF